MNFGILEWTDEHSKGDYPLTKNIGIRAVIVDATFLQFDGSVPVLNSIEVEADKAYFNITFDRETLDVEVSSDTYSDTKTVRIYESDTTRYMGALVLGQGFLSLFSDYVGTTIEVDCAFAANTVITVNKKAGVFSLAGLTGALNISTTDNIFFGEDADANTAIWNAVSVPADPADLINPLRTLNGVSPIRNQVIIKDSEILKIVPEFNAVTISLANSVLNDNIGPTTNYA